MFWSNIIFPLGPLAGRNTLHFSQYIRNLIDLAPQYVISPGAHALPFLYFLSPSARDLILFRSLRCNMTFIRSLSEILLPVQSGLSSQSTYGTGHLDLLSLDKIIASSTTLILTRVGARAREGECRRNQKYAEINVAETDDGIRRWDENGLPHRQRSDRNSRWHITFQMRGRKGIAREEETRSRKGWVIRQQVNIRLKLKSVIALLGKFPESDRFRACSIRR